MVLHDTVRVLLWLHRISLIGESGRLILFYSLCLTNLIFLKHNNWVIADFFLKVPGKIPSGRICNPTVLNTWDLQSFFAVQFIGVGNCCLNPALYDGPAPAGRQFGSNGYYNMWEKPRQG
jgi:hypothetical protein